MILKYLKNRKLGLIKQGLTREEVRKIFKTEVYEFQKTPYCRVLTDTFHALDIHAYYNEDTNKLEGLEIFHPNRLYYTKEILILRHDFEIFLRTLKNNKIKYSRDVLGLSLENGIIDIYVPHDDEESPECTSVYVDLTQDCSLDIM